MSVPTRAELHTEVDRQFRERYPDAPEQLDPDDPSQSDLVAAWLELRDDIVNQWTNDVFFRHFPEAGKLNPDDPGDSLLIEYWVDIRDLIRDDTPSRYNWQGEPPPADAPVSPPYGQNADDVQLQADPAAAPANEGKPHPEIDIDTPEELESWVESAAHGAHELGDVAHVAELLAHAAENIAYARAVAVVGVDVTEGVAFGGAGVAEVAQYGRITAIVDVLGVVTKVLSAIGDIALVVWVGYQVIQAFRGEREDQKRFGYIYGVMWEALDEADHIRVYSIPGITYSEAELQEAFIEGVAEGRAKGAEPAIKNGIKLWVASVAVESGLGVWSAAQQVITAIYDRAHGKDSRLPLEWPAPLEFNGFFP